MATKKEIAEIVAMVVDRLDPQEQNAQPIEQKKVSRCFTGPYSEWMIFHENEWGDVIGYHYNHHPNSWIEFAIHPQNTIDSNEQDQTDRTNWNRLDPTLRLVADRRNFKCAVKTSPRLITILKAVIRTSVFYKN